MNGFKYLMDDHRRTEAFSFGTVSSDIRTVTIVGIRRLRGTVQITDVPACITRAEAMDVARTGRFLAMQQSFWRFRHRHAIAAQRRAAGLPDIRPKI